LRLSLGHLFLSRLRTQVWTVDRECAALYGGEVC
jgi:hypothetical protein